MKYNIIRDYSAGGFRRLTGIKYQTFIKMLDILKEAETQKTKQGGKPNSLFMEDRLLMTLEYLREYRTYFHVASSYGISESACYRNIRWIEDTLIKHKDFATTRKKSIA